MTNEDLNPFQRFAEIAAHPAVYEIRVTHTRTVGKITFILIDHWGYDERIEIPESSLVDGTFPQELGKVVMAFNTLLKAIEQEHAKCCAHLWGKENNGEQPGPQEG